MGMFTIFEHIQTHKHILSYTADKKEVVQEPYLQALETEGLPVLKHTKVGNNMYQYDLTGYMSVRQTLTQGILPNKQVIQWLIEYFDILKACKRMNISGAFLIPDLDFVFVGTDQKLKTVIMPTDKLPVQTTINRVFAQAAEAWQPENATGTALKEELYRIATNDDAQVLLNIEAFLDTAKYKVKLVSSTTPQKVEEVKPEILSQPIRETVEPVTVRPAPVPVRQFDPEPEPIAPVEALPTALGLTDDTTLLTGFAQAVPTVHKLEVLSTNGESYSLKEGEYEIGSSVHAAISIGTRTVSRTHARLKYESGRVYILDRGSTNGTFIDGLPIRTKNEYYDITDSGSVVVADVRLDFREV